MTAAAPSVATEQGQRGRRSCGDVEETGGAAVLSARNETFYLNDEQPPVTLPTGGCPWCCVCSVGDRATEFGARSGRQGEWPLAQGWSAGSGWRSVDTRRCFAREPVHTVPEPSGCFNCTVGQRSRIEARMLLTHR